MGIAIAIFGVALAASGIWLVVRLVNRPKKLGKVFWATLALVAALVGYVLSVGPVCWVASQTGLGSSVVTRIYRPLTRIASGWRGIAPALHSYCHIGAAPGWEWIKLGGVWHWTYIP